MLHSSQYPIPVEKEIINAMNFHGKEVLTEKAAKKDLLVNLKKAMIIGNTNHTKVKIVFKGNGTFHVVDTTIWGLTRNYAILKSNTLIPISAIREVLFE